MLKNIKKPEISLRKPWHRRSKLVELALIAGISAGTGSCLYHKKDFLNEKKNQVVSYFNELGKEKQKNRELELKIRETDFKYSKDVDSIKNKYSLENESLKKQYADAVKTIDSKYKDINLKLVSESQTEIQNLKDGLIRSEKRNVKAVSLIDKLNDQNSETSKENLNLMDQIKTYQFKIDELNRDSTMYRTHIKSLHQAIENLNSRSSKENTSSSNLKRYSSKEEMENEISENLKNLDFSIGNSVIIENNAWLLARNYNKEELYHTSGNGKWEVQWRGTPEQRAFAVQFFDNKYGMVILQDSTYVSFDGGGNWEKRDILRVGGINHPGKKIKIRDYNIIDNYCTMKYEITNYSGDYDTKVEAYVSEDFGRTWKLNADCTY